MYLENQRLHEALRIFLDLYGHKLEGQMLQDRRAHKGMPLVWITEAFRLLGFPVHAKRYLMLALCEDAITNEGITTTSGGAYFRLVWFLGLPDTELRRYVSEFWKLSKQAVGDAAEPRHQHLQPRGVEAHDCLRSTRAPAAPGSAVQPSGSQIVQSDSAMATGPRAGDRDRAPAGRTGRTPLGSDAVARMATTSTGASGRAKPLRCWWASWKAAADDTVSSWLWPA